MNGEVISDPSKAVEAVTAAMAHPAKGFFVDAEDVAAADAQAQREPSVADRLAVIRDACWRLEHMHRQSASVMSEVRVITSELDLIEAECRCAEHGVEEIMEAGDGNN
jgi:hypothetical protein